MTTDDRLALWVLGQLDPDEDAAMARLVAENPALARRAEEFREVLQLLPDPAVTPLPIITESAATRRVPASRISIAVAAVALLLVGAGAGFAASSLGTPDGPPRETVAVAGPAAASVTSAELINHTWGVELLLSLDDTVEGQDYLVFFVDDDGNVADAGGFVGDADRIVDCRMNTALLREETTRFRIVDGDGRIVLTAELPEATDLTPGGVPDERAAGLLRPPSVVEPGDQ